MPRVLIVPLDCRRGYQEFAGGVDRGRRSTLGCFRCDKRVLFFQDRKPGVPQSDKTRIQTTHLTPSVLISSTFP